jgi:hypothetical protein
LAFFVISDAGFAVGVVTHVIPKLGSLIWIAKPTFEEEPGLDEVSSIHRWRWATFFPVDAAIRRKLITPIGEVAIPEGLRPFPPMRSGTKQQGWQMVSFHERGSQPLGPATDPSTPIYQVVNDTRLKEMIVSGWRPEDEW